MTIGRIAGIPLRLHSSFLWLGALIVLFQLASGGLAAGALAVLFAVAVFGSVLLHELGHALAARSVGIRTRDITLYPFGGIAALEGEARSARQELWIALAGPLVNLALFVVFLPLGLLGSTAVLTLAAINLGMGLFNLLPAFPMDGGRVLRAMLAPRFGYYGASALALRVGRGFAWAFLALGLFASPNLLLVGGFLLYATWRERLRLRWLARNQPEPWRIPTPRSLVRFVEEPGFAHPVAR